MRRIGLALGLALWAGTAFAQQQDIAIPADPQVTQLESQMGMMLLKLANYENQIRELKAQAERAKTPVPTPSPPK